MRAAIVTHACRIHKRLIAPRIERAIQTIRCIVYRPSSRRVHNIYYCYGSIKRVRNDCGAIKRILERAFYGLCAIKTRAALRCRRRRVRSRFAFSCAVVNRLSRNQTKPQRRQYTSAARAQPKSTKKKYTHKGDRARALALY